MRRLFLAHCRWEWLFGFENREGLFPIRRSYKFNPVIVQKGGTTAAIRTAFMRRGLDDWEHAEALATPYAVRQVARFSPKSQAILEIQSPRISVLLGDDGPNGWGIRYAREFDMTNDSRLFPPRPQWEAKGYRRAAPTTPRHSTRPTFLRLAACSSRRRDAPRTPTPRSQPPRRAWLRPPAP